MEFLSILHYSASSLSLSSAILVPPNPKFLRQGKTSLPCISVCTVAFVTEAFSARSVKNTDTIQIEHKCDTNK